MSGENSEENFFTRLHRRDYSSGWQCVIRHQVWRNWWSDDHNKNYLDEEKGDTKPFLEESVNGVNEHKNIENDCVLTKINNSNIRNKKTKRKPKFSREEKSNILNNEMFSDESIDLAQQLLKK